MSNPKGSRPPPFRSSHLRKVSVGSSTAPHQQTPNSAIEAIESPAPHLDVGKSSNASVRRLCSLSIHDESFSADDVVVNLSQFPADNIHGGDLLYVPTQGLTGWRLTMTVAVLRQITALRDPDRDVENSRNSMQTASSDRNRKRDTSHDREASAPVFIAAVAGIQGAPHLDDLHLDRSKRHVFVAKGTSPEQNAKQPGVQV